ncbi:MAG: type III PLP-dependent enzyme [Acidobacteria bacterium]|nr:type III PLP-dependent enzyme [Acidobacteriota bacterium]
MKPPLQWSAGEAQLGGVGVEQIAATCGTPLYLYDQSTFLAQLRRLRQALPEAIEIYYSVKANPNPKIISIFVERGCGCEIASGGEYVLARRAGAAPEKIVFAGPGKGREELEHVIAHGIGEIHLESFDEMALAEEFAENLGERVSVALRINPSTASGGGLLMGGQPTAFGFEEESLPEVLAGLARCPHLRLRGVHLYTGTQILDAQALLAHWRHALTIARQTAELRQEPVRTIDLGGGLGIPYFAHEKELDLEALSSGAQALVRDAHSDRWLEHSRFVVEPGRFLAGPAGLYVARARSVKSCRGTTFVVLDGGMNHNLAASGNLGQVVRRDYPIVNLSRREGAESTVVVVGPLCTPIDTLGRKVRMSSPRTGDLIAVLQSGAYGMTASPLEFLGHPTPAEVLVGAGQYEVIRAQQTGFGASRTVREQNESSLLSTEVKL